MPGLQAVGMQSEQEFAALVDALVAKRDPHELTELLREDHPVYEQRGTATIVRMRGWLLLALAQVGVPDDALLYVLEELDTGLDAYLVAAAARALRRYPRPDPSLAPFVMRALTRIRYQDEPISFDNYGEYLFSSSGTSAVRELLATLAWLGPHARAVLSELESFRAQGGFSRKLSSDLDHAMEAIRAGIQSGNTNEQCCDLPGALKNAFFWPFSSRRGCEQIESTLFEDHNGELISFNDFFRGRPSIVVFFYTRCDNPLKCSLTITKLGLIQKLLKEQGFAEQIRTAAITYDPTYDRPDRVRGYGEDRNVLMNEDHRILRTTEDFDTVRRYFKLSLNFVESLVNRHRIEVHVLDAQGQIAATFQRIHWQEQKVVDRAIEVLNESAQRETESTPQDVTNAVRRNTTWAVFGTLSSLGVAFFPKCPICWAAYLSFFGIAGLNQIPYSPWLRPVLIAMMLINLGSVWLRGRSNGQMSAFCLVAVGALIILISNMLLGVEKVAIVGIVLTLAGSLLSAWSTKKVRSPRITPVN